LALEHLPPNSVGVMGDERTYEKTALRAVESTAENDWTGYIYLMIS
jgi:GMP synthase PP-ATPase subunit